MGMFVTGLMIRGEISGPDELGRARVEKVGDGSDKLGRCEWLLQHEAVGDAFGRPSLRQVGTRTARDD